MSELARKNVSSVYIIPPREMGRLLADRYFTDEILFGLSSKGIDSVLQTTTDLIFELNEHPASFVDPNDKFLTSYIKSLESLDEIEEGFTNRMNHILRLII